MLDFFFRKAYYCKEFCVSKLVGLDNKNIPKDYENSLTQLALTVHGLIFGRAYNQKDFCIWGAYFREGLFIYFIYFFFVGGGGYHRNFMVI